MKRTIKERLNSEEHIQIGQQCMARLASLLGCGAGTVNTEGNTSFIDFKQNGHLDLPFYSVGDLPNLSVWQTANKIMYTGIDELAAEDDLRDAARQLHFAGCRDAKAAVSAKMLKRKSVVFDVRETGALRAEYSFDGELRSRLEFSNADKLAGFIYGQIKNDYEKCNEIVRKLQKAMKKCNLEFEKILNRTAMIMQSATKNNNFSNKIY